MIELFLCVAGAVFTGVWAAGILCSLLLIHQTFGIRAAAKSSLMGLAKYLASGPLGATDLWWLCRSASTPTQDYRRDSASTVPKATHLLPHTYYN